MDLQEQSQHGVVTKASKSRLGLTKKSTKRASSNKQTKLKITFKDQMMNRLVFEKEGLPENTKVYYKSSGKILLEGHKQGRGIFCYCCNREVSASQFEAHAGMASRKKPYGSIFVSNGLSLEEYALSLKLAHSSSVIKTRDQACTVCKRGGDLLPCDGCPRSFHKECRSESGMMERKWFCENCWKTLKRPGQNAIEKIAEERIQIVHNPEQHQIVACAICKTYDFNENGFDDRTVIICDQCEKEYHIGCLRKENMADLKALPHGKWFCLPVCEKLHSALDVLVNSGPEKVPVSYIYMIRKKSKNDMGCIADSNVKWTLIRGKDASAENALLLEDCVNIFHDRFSPIIDSLTGNDFIPSMAYGLTMGAQDFAGVHCAVLTIDSKVVTAGMFRVFGHKLVELPIVATSRSYQGKGYFRLFFSCFERLLSYLMIKKIWVPAADDAKSMWTDKFGFEEVCPLERSTYMQTQTSMVAFRGTTWLLKKVPSRRKTYKEKTKFSFLDLP